MTDASSNDRAAIRRLLAKIEEARTRDFPDTDPATEDLTEGDARFRSVLREESRGQWAGTHDDAIGTGGGADAGPARTAGAARPVRHSPRSSSPAHANDDFEDEWRLAAEGNAEARWVRLDYRLCLPDRKLEVFREAGDNCVSVRADDCNPEWTGLTLGGFTFDFARNEADPKWLGLAGCQLDTLRRIADRGEIDAHPV